MSIELTVNERNDENGDDNITSGFLNVNGTENIKSECSNDLSKDTTIKTINNVEATPKILMLNQDDTSEFTTDAKYGKEKINVDVDVGTHKLNTVVDPGMFRKLEPRSILSGEFRKNRLFGMSTEFSTKNNQDWMGRNFFIPADHQALFYHHQVAELPLIRAIFYKGMYVVLKQDHEKTEKTKYKIIAIASPNLILSNEEDELIQVNCWDVEYIKYDKNDIEEYENKWTRYLSEKLCNDVINFFITKKKYETPLYKCIIRRSVLEVINQYNQNLVDTATVVNNQYGLLTLQYSDGSTEIIHMASVRLKQYGWLKRTHDTNFMKSKRYVKESSRKAVFPFVFDQDPFDGLNTEQSVFTQPLTFTPHKFIKNNLVTVLDPITRFKYYPGVVTRVYNEYFFRVTIIASVNKPIDELNHINCDHASPWIIPFVAFPRGGLTLPVGMISNDQLTCEGLSNALDLPLTVGNAAKFVSLIPDGEKMNPFYDEDDDNFDLQPVKKCLPRTMVEILEDDKTTVIGRILRVTKQFMVISLETDVNFSSPKLYSFTDMNVFPIGFNKLAKLKSTPSVHSLMPAFPIKSFDDEFTSVIGDNSGKTYISKKNLNKLQWSPKIVVNKNCYCGPFINKDQFWRLTDSYGPGNLEQVLKQLLNDLTTCCITHKIAHLLEVKKIEGYPYMIFKHYDNDGNERKHSSNRTVYTTMACHSVYELPQYLNIVCRLIDACPGFIVVGDSSKECNYGCSIVNDELNYMLPENHIHTSYSVYSTEMEKLRGPRKRKTIVEQLEETKGPSISPKKKKISISEEEDEEEDDIIDEDDDVDYLSRHSISIDGRKPSVVRPVQQIGEDSDSIITVSSDDSDDDEPAPELVSQINAIPRPVNIPVSKPQIGMPVLQSQFRPPLPKLHTTNNGTYLRTSTPMGSGPRLRLANPSSSAIPQLQQFSVMNEQNPILDPIKRQLPRLTKNTTPRSSLPGDCRLSFDPMTGKHVMIGPTRQPVTFNGFPYQSPAPSIENPVLPESRRISIEYGDVKLNLPLINSNPRKWKTAQICAYLRKAKFEDPVIELINSYGVEGEEFISMKSGKFQEIGLKLGPALRLEKLAQKVKYVADLEYSGGR